MTTWNDIDPSAWATYAESGAYLWTLRLTAPADCSSLTSIRVYCSAADATSYHIKGVLVLSGATPPSTSAIVANGVTGASVVGTSAAWVTCTFATPPAVTAGAAYWVGVISDYGVTLRMPTSAGPGIYYLGTAYASITSATSVTSASLESAYNLGIQGIYTAGGAALTRFLSILGTGT
jgi:hypothetical protein